MSSSRTESVAATGLIRRVWGDALLGAACGALYGAVFGGFGHLVHGRTWQLFSNAAICALVGLTLAAVATAWQRSRENAGAPSTGSLREENAERGESGLRVHRDHDPSSPRGPNGARVRTLTVG